MTSPGWHQLKWHEYNCLIAKLRNSTMNVEEIRKVFLPLKEKAPETISTQLSPFRFADRDNIIRAKEKSYNQLGSKD